jgi:hypothetical protein
LGTLSKGFATSAKKFAAQKKETDEQKNKAWLIKNEFLPATIQGNPNYAIGDLY